MPRLRTALCLALVTTTAFSLPLAAQGPRGSRPAVSPETFAADTRAYLEALEKMGFAGVALVEKGGEPLFAAGFGLADREQGIPWTPATVTTVGSITKQFTGAAMLLLAEEGKVRVEDPIRRYFAAVPEDKQGITLHHLLTHSSGIVDLAGYGDFDAIGREDFVRRSLAQPLAFAPGEGYEYSNAGYSLLGAILEQETGAPYEDFLRRRLLLPQGLYETGYLQPAWGEGRLAQGYRGGERWGTVVGRPMAADGPYWVLRANGGIHSTAYDMLRWSRALLDGKVLPPAAMERLWEPHVEEGEGAGTFYGYGWSVQEVEGLPVITHNGGNGIFFADLALVPGADAVLYVATNVAADLPLVEGLLGRLGHRLLAGRAYPPVPAVVEAKPEELAGRAGVYRLEAGGELEVRAEEGALLVEPRDPQGFAALLSTVSAAAGRAEALSARAEAFVGAMLAGDYGPLHEAYGGAVTLERLQEVWSQRLESLAAEHGALAGFDVLGTALRGERDWTVVRFRFAGGAREERAFVWEGGEGETLLGVSIRGLAPALRFFPVKGGGYASFDPATGDSQPLRFSPGGVLTVGEGEGALAASRQ